MIPNHPQFIEAIAERKKVRVRFYSTADSGIVERICAALDYGPGAGPYDGLNRYWIWDYARSPNSQTLGLVPKQIVEVRVLGEEFQPADFGAVTWPWGVPRTWGGQIQPPSNP